MNNSERHASFFRLSEIDLNFTAQPRDVYRQYTTKQDT